MASIRNGLVILAICALPVTANAACGLFSPCGSPSWIGFSLALPVPRLPHLHTFATHSNQSPFCGAGQYGVGTPGWDGGCGVRRGLLGRRRGCGLGGGCCVNPCGPSAFPPLYSPPPVISTPPTYPTMPINPTPPTFYPPTGLSSCNPCVQPVPVAQTEYVPQQTVSYRDVPQTSYRQEAYTENVPVTTYQQVTRFRSVPYQTVARIPQVSTQLVPRQRVSYAMPTAPITTACNSCDLAHSTAYAPITAALPYAATPYALPQTASVPQPPMAATLEPRIEANSAAQQWQSIPQRQAREQSDVQQMGYLRQSAVHPMTPRRSMFQPAPSAASVWQSRFIR